MSEVIVNQKPQTTLRTADFYYDLPEERIAQHPIEPRDASRMMVLDRASGSLTHRHFYDVLEYLQPNDVLVINDSKVIPARLYGHAEGREEAAIELLLLRQHELDTWEVLVKPGKRARIGMRLVFGNGMLRGEVLDLVDGRAPIIVEIKGTSMKNMRVCELTAEMLDGYGGKYCIEAFNPIFVRWWKKNRKHVVRGQLSNKMKKEESGQSPFVNFLLENLMLSFLARPDFVAYCAGNRKQPSFRFSCALGAYPVGWTIRTEEDVELCKNDFKAIIFENVRP